MPDEILDLYEMSPHIYDEYISTEMEKRNFDEVLDSIKRHRQTDGLISIFDMCCGTGIFPRKWLSKLENILYVGVDINKDFLRFARSRDPDVNHHYINDDAVSIDLGQEFDFVIGTSAYHHIEDKNKVKFLENINRHLKSLYGKKAIIYEKFIPPFTNPIEAARSGTEFYMERIGEMMEKEKLNDIQLFALYNELYLTAVRKGEYKVPYSCFVEDVEKAGFKIYSHRKMWTSGRWFYKEEVGDAVIELEKK